MFKDYEEATEYLVDHGWVTARQVTAGLVEIISISRRHCNCRVDCTGGPSHFLKQGVRDQSGMRVRLGSVAYEARVYQLLKSLFDEKVFSNCLPTFRAFDPAEDLLILEAIPAFGNWSDYHLCGGRVVARMGCRLAAALAQLHSGSFHESVRIKGALGTPSSPPWIFSLPEPDHWVYVNCSTAARELIKIIQKNADSLAAFARLRNEWQDTCLIHGDLKWENLLVRSDPAAKSEDQLSITDWELARLGDPRWDLGSVFCEYLYSWLSSIPIAPGVPPDTFLEFARFPLHRIHPSIRSCWEIYAREMHIPNQERPTWLWRAVEYAGIRLVQRAFEQSQVETQLSDKVVLLLQVCVNILAKPREAAVRLLGLPLVQSRPYGK